METSVMAFSRPPLRSGLNVAGNYTHSSLRSLWAKISRPSKTAFSPDSRKKTPKQNQKHLHKIWFYLF